MPNGGEGDNDLLEEKMVDTSTQFQSSMPNGGEDDDDDDSIEELINTAEELINTAKELIITAEELIITVPDDLCVEGRYNPEAIREAEDTHKDQITEIDNINDSCDPLNLISLKLESLLPTSIIELPIIRILFFLLFFLYTVYKINSLYNGSNISNYIYRIKNYIKNHYK
jgi:hypothetical protein